LRGEKIGRTQNIPEISEVRPGCVHRISSAAACLHALRSTVRPACTKSGFLRRVGRTSTAAALQAATASGASPWGRHADFWLSWRAREAGFRWGDSCVKHYYRIPQGDPKKQFPLLFSLSQDSRKRHPRNFPPLLAPHQVSLHVSTNTTAMQFSSVLKVD
jgi:hypothetical protein